MNDAAGAGPALPTASDVAARLAAVRDRIRAAGGDPEAVNVIGVTKGQPRDVVALALEAGLHDLGENYAQELLAKAEPPPGAARHAGVEPRWHFIGHLQRNKVRQLAPLISCWQSVDRPELVDELVRRAPGARILIQVNATGEAQKGGCRPADCPALVERAGGAGLVVAGLMTVGPTDGPDGIVTDPTPGFELVRGLVDRLGLAVCSMGMTGDLEAAVRCGSTMVRIGTALFGPRASTRPVGH